MKDRDFNIWINSLQNSIATWEYYTDFDKVKIKIESIKIELNILNSLVGSKNIELDFMKILSDYPQVLKCIPILIAKREMEIIIKEPRKDYTFNFNKANYSVDEYILFMRNTGIFDLLENHIISNLLDYVSGVEVGLDSNARKNRTGHEMEKLVEGYIKESNFDVEVEYYKEMEKSEIEKKWNIDLAKISNNGKTEKRFDFVIKTATTIYAIEVNFYSGGGSKLNETARSYKNIAVEAQDIEGFKFIWITDGIGWKTARKNLLETFEILEHIYNLNDLKSGALLRLIK